MKRHNVESYRLPDGCVVRAKESSRPRKGSKRLKPKAKRPARELNDGNM